MLVSFGSILKTEYLPTNLQNIMIAAVERFESLKFLWNWDGIPPVKLTRNVLFQNWFPQNDLLGQRNSISF